MVKLKKLSSKIKHKLQKESKVKQNVKHKKESNKDSPNGS